VKKTKKQAKARVHVEEGGGWSTLVGSEIGHLNNQSKEQGRGASRKMDLFVQDLNLWPEKYFAKVWGKWG